MTVVRRHLRPTSLGVTRRLCRSVDATYPTCRHTDTDRERDIASDSTPHCDDRQRSDYSSSVGRHQNKTKKKIDKKSSHVCTCRIYKHSFYRINQTNIKMFSITIWQRAERLHNEVNCLLVGTLYFTYDPSGDVIRSSINKASLGNSARLPTNESCKIRL